jgi:hypothetical protein
MTEEQLSEEIATEILRSLLQKEGTWVDWGKNCQRLQKAGYNPQTIFEITGFQASQQNLVIVAAQVYDTIAKGGGSQEVLDYFLGPRSDVLYELRILNQEQRVAVAEVAMNKALTAEAAKDLAKAVQEMSRISQVPSGFTRHPGDAMAYQCWKRARQKKDLQERSRLIAQGLKFAYSEGARSAIEQLLSDFTVVPTVKAPLLPIYRLESDTELPCLIPVAGTLPLTSQDFAQVPSLTLEEPFGSVKTPANIHIVPIPGWQAILKAVDPVGILASSSELREDVSSNPETVLIVVDRHLTTWNVQSYFLVAEEDNLAVRWFETQPDVNILGQVILILRPKRILDENNLLEPWQMDD